MTVPWPSLHSPLALRLADSLLHFTWQGVAWAALLWLGLALLGHRGAPWRHLACLFVLPAWPSPPS